MPRVGGGSIVMDKMQEKKELKLLCHSDTTKTFTDNENWIMKIKKQRKNHFHEGRTCISSGLLR